MLKASRHPPGTNRQGSQPSDLFLRYTIPFLEIVEEQDKLAAERKLVELLANKFNGKARHTDLMNSAHMKRREFKECVESLIEREAISVETYLCKNNKAARLYVLSREIMDSWQIT